MKKLILTALTSILLFGCASTNVQITKRKHRKGYHVSYSSKNEVKKPLLNTKKSKERVNQIRPLPKPNYSTQKLTSNRIIPTVAQPVLHIEKHSNSAQNTGKLSSKKQNKISAFFKKTKSRTALRNDLTDEDLSRREKKGKFLNYLSIGLFSILLISAILISTNVSVALSEILGLLIIVSAVLGVLSSILGFNLLRKSDNKLHKIINYVCLGLSTGIVLFVVGTLFYFIFALSA